MKGNKLRDKVTAAAKSISKEKSWRQTSWETRRQRRPRAAQKRNQEGRQAWKRRRPRRETMKGDKLGRQGGSGGKEQPRMEIIKKNKLGRQGGSGSQERPRMEIMKGDKRGRQGGSGSQAQPRIDIMKGRQGGSGVWRFRGSATQSLGSKNPFSFQLSGEWREQSLGDKAVAASRPFGNFGDQQPSHWEVRTPIDSSYLGKNCVCLAFMYLHVLGTV